MCATDVVARCSDEGMTFSRAWAMPNGRTFTIPPIRDFVEEAVAAVDVCNGGVILDPFANSCRYGTVTNDLNPEYGCDFCMDALEFLKSRGDEEADLVLYDPPYSITQASQLYKSYGKDKLEVNVSNMGYWARCKNEIARVLKPGGVVLSFGWNSNGIGKNRGFVKDHLLIVAHGGSKNDTLCLKEHKVA